MKSPQGIGAQPWHDNRLNKPPRPGSKVKSLLMSKYGVAVRINRVWLLGVQAAVEKMNV